MLSGSDLVNVCGLAIISSGSRDVDKDAAIDTTFWERSAVLCRSANDSEVIWSQTKPVPV